MLSGKKLLVSNVTRICKNLLSPKLSFSSLKFGSNNSVDSDVSLINYIVKRQKAADIMSQPDKVLELCRTYDKRNSNILSSGEIDLFDILRASKDVSFVRL